MLSKIQIDIFYKNLIQVTTYSIILINLTIIFINLECTLTNNQISNYYDEATNTWSISSADLTDDLENDIQSIFDCASDGDYVMFNTENTIIPDDTISISKNLTISFFTDSIESENGAFPETETKVVFNCPEDKAIFNIEY